MSDFIEVSINSYEAAFAARGVPGWHMLGTVFPQDEVVSTSDMLDKAHLSNWNVRLDDLEVPGVTPDRWATNYYAVVRDNPFDGQRDVLSVVGQRYTVVQNEEVFGFGDMVLDGGGQWETAGSIKGGTQIFGTLAMPREIVIDPQGAGDKIDTYLLVASSHDGSLAVTALVTGVRVVCSNTLNMALKGARQKFSIRHTSTVEGKIAAARDALNITFAYADALEEEAQALYAQSMTDAEFIKIMTQIFPEPTNESKAAKTRWDNKITMLESIFSGTADGPDTTANIRNTAWAGLNALTESIDWYRKPRKGDAESVLIANAGLDPVVQAEKNSLRTKFLALI